MCLYTNESGCRNYYNHSNPNAQCHPSRKGTMKLYFFTIHLFYFTGILCGSCVNNTGVGVISFTCLDNCHVPIGIIAIILLGIINTYICIHLYIQMFFFCSIVLWNGILAILFLWLSQKFPPNLKGILFYIQVWCMAVSCIVYYISTQVVPYATGYFPVTVFRHKLFVSNSVVC